MGFAEDIQKAEFSLKEKIALRKSAIDAAEAHVRDAKANLRKAESDRASRIKDGEKSVRHAEKDREEKIKDVEKKIRSTERMFNKRVGSYQGLVLYPDRLVDGKTTLPLGPDVDARVETAGDIYSYTGLMSGLSHNWYASDVKDKRTLAVTVKSPQGAVVAMGDPDEEKEAREFAALVANTAARAAGVVAAREEELEALRRDLELIKGDTAEIDKAQAALRSISDDTELKAAIERAEAAVSAASRALEAAENDTSEIDEARSAIDRLKASAPEDEVSAYEAEHKKKTLRKIAIMAGAAVVVLAIIAVVFFIMQG